MPAWPHLRAHSCTRLPARPCSVQYMHIPDGERCNWLRARIETAEPQEYSQEEKLRILDRLTWSEMFESFLANKYTAAKRWVRWEGAGARKGEMVDGSAC